jgi:hypothetical protein
MARKKLLAKTTTKKTPLRKKLQTVDKSQLSDLFDPEKIVKASANIITDDYNVVLILDDTDEFITKNKLDNTIETFEIDENDLQIEYNRTKEIKPVEEDNLYNFESIGNITKAQYDWFKTNYPLCTFYQINRWFGKSVNTLVIVLAEALGKPVGVLKTTE